MKILSDSKKRYASSVFEKIVVAIFVFALASIPANTGTPGPLFYLSIFSSVIIFLVGWWIHPDKDKKGE